MKSVSCLSALSIILVACSTTGADGGTSGPRVTLVSVQGIVQDSVAGKPVTGALVQAGTKSATTDFLGAYQIVDIPAGAVTLTISIPKFEPFTKVLQLSTTSTTYNVPLRRLSPFLTSFSGASNSTIVVATVSDLQSVTGLGGFVKVSGNNATFGNYDLLEQIPGSAWSVLTPNSSRVQQNTSQLGIRTAEWSISDAEGNRVIVDCVIGGACAEQ